MKGKLSHLEEFRRLRQEQLKREGAATNTSFPPPPSRSVSHDEADDKSHDIDDDKHSETEYLYKPSPSRNVARSVPKHEVELSLTRRSTDSKATEHTTVELSTSASGARHKEPIGIATPAKRRSSKDADGLVMSASLIDFDDEVQVGTTSTGRPSEPVAFSANNSLDSFGFDEIPLNPSSQSATLAKAARSRVFFASPQQGINVEVGDTSSTSFRHDMASKASPVRDVFRNHPIFPTPPPHSYGRANASDDDGREGNFFHNNGLLSASPERKGTSSLTPSPYAGTPKLVLQQRSKLEPPPVLHTSSKSRMTPTLHLPEEDWNANDTSSTASDMSPQKLTDESSTQANHSHRHRRIKSSPDARDATMQPLLPTRHHPVGIQQVNGPVPPEKTPKHTTRESRHPVRSIDGTRRFSDSPITPSIQSNIPPPETLWERNKTLVNEVRFADQTCVELAMRNRALEEQMELMKQSFDRLRSEEERSQLRVVQLESDLKVSQAGRGSLLAQVSKQATGVESEGEEELIARIQELEGTCNEQRTVIAHTVQKLRSVTSENASLSRKLERANGGSTFQSLDRIAEVEALNLELVQSAELVLNITQTVKQELEESKKAIERVTERNSILQDRVEELECRCQDISASDREHEHQLDQLQSEKVELKKAVETLQTDAVVRDSLVSELDLRCHDRAASLSALESQLADSRREMKRREDDLELERRKLTSLMETSERQCAELKAELAQSGESRTRLLERVLELETQVSSLIDEKGGLESDLMAVASVLATQRSAIRELEAQGASYEAGRLSLHLELERTESEVKRQQQKASNCADESLSLQALLSDNEVRYDAICKENQRLEFNLGTAVVDVERLSSELKLANASLKNSKAFYESRVAGVESKLAESVSALECLKREYQVTERQVGEVMHSAVVRMDRQATVLENQVSQFSNDVYTRLCNLEKDLHFIKESTDFQVESQKEEATSVDREMSTLTGHSGPSQLRRNVAGPLQIVAVEDILNATFESPCDKSTDLQLMEEARYDLSRMEHAAGEGASNAASDVTNDDDQDSLSSIEGISHLFAPNNESELSLSASEHQDVEAAGNSMLQSSVLWSGTVDTSRDQSVGDLDKEISSMDRKEYRRKLRALQRRKLDLEDQLNAKEDELATANSCLALVRGERDSLQFRLKDLTTSPARPRETLNTDTPMNKLSLWSPFISPMNMSRSFIDHSSEAYQDRVESSTEAKDALSVECVALRSELDSVRAENAELSNQLRSTSALLTQKTEQCSNEIKRHSGHSDALERELMLVKGELEDARGKTELMESEQLRLEHMLGRLQLEIAACDEARVTQTVDLKRCLEENEIATRIRLSLEASIQSHSQQRKQLSEENEALRKELAAANSQHIQAQKGIEELHERLQNLCREKEDVSSELGGMLARHEELENECERLARDLSSASRQCSEMKGQYDDSRTALECAKAQIAVLLDAEQKLVTTESENVNLHQLLEESKHALKEYETRLAESNEAATKALHNLRLELDESLRSKHRLNEELGAKAAELEQARVSLRAALAQTSELRQELEDSIAASKESRIVLEQTAEEHLQKIQALGLSLAEAKEELLHCQNELRLAKEYSAHSEGLAAHAEERWVELQSVLGTVRTERDEFMAKCLVFEEKLKLEAKANWDLELDLKNCREALDSVRSELQQAEESRDDANEGRSVLAAEVSDLRQQVQELTETVEAGNQQLSEVSGSRQELVDELSSVQAKKAKLEEKVNGLRKYVQKLMLKCEEWEDYCHDQSKVLRKLKEFYDRMQKMVLERDQVYNTERAMWTTERSNLTYIHHTLEEEMEAIARELIDYSPNHPETLVPSS